MRSQFPLLPPSKKLDYHIAQKTCVAYMFLCRCSVGIPVIPVTPVPFHLGFPFTLSHPWSLPIRLLPFHFLSSLHLLISINIIVLSLYSALRITISITIIVLSLYSALRIPISCLVRLFKHSPVLQSHPLYVHSIQHCMSQPEYRPYRRHKT